MRFGSLFAGIGGMDLGLERAGMGCAWQVEIDPFCRKVLTKHWPDVPKYEDVRDVGVHNLGPVDFVCGGPPCQPFSTASAGKRAGTSDDRWLWPEMLRIVQGLRPRYALVENVVGFDGPGLESVVSDMEASGYEVLPPLEVPACAFGHDHWRPRIWVLGYTNKEGEPRGPLHAEMAELQGVSGEVWRTPSNGSGIRSGDGLPARMDGRGALGNAVVPQVAEWIGRRIMEAERAMEDAA